MKGKSIKSNSSNKTNINKHSNQLNNSKHTNFILFSFLLIIVTGLSIYSNSFKNAFVFDDVNNIVKNTAIHDISDVKAWWHYSAQRPISMLTFALNYHFGALNVLHYHITNFIIHLICSFLVWWLSVLIFATPHMEEKPISQYKYYFALFTALLFVSHPLATQSVTYIVQRMNALATMFYLLSLTLYVKARLSQKLKKNPYFLFVSALIFALLAVLSKENAYTLPFTFITFEIFFLRDKKTQFKLSRIKILAIASLLIGFFIFVFYKFSFNIFKPIPISDGNDVIITPLYYALTQFSVILKYIQLLIIPLQQNIDYDFPISSNFFEIRTLFSFLALACILFLSLYLFKKNRLMSFGIFWFFITLSIESSIIPIHDVIFEHRTYLPSIGYFFIVVTIIFSFIWVKHKNVAVLILTIIILAHSFLTYNRNKVWKDDLSLWTDASLKSPNKARPINNRGYALSQLGQFKKAIPDFNKAIKLKNNYADPYFNKGFAYANLGEINEAIKNFDKAIEIQPKYVEAFYNRGTAFAHLGMIDKSIEDFSKAIELFPEYSNALFNRGISYYNTEEWEKAIADFKTVLIHDKNNKEAIYYIDVISQKLSLNE